MTADPSIRTTIINTDQPVEVRIGRDCDGRWFRMLNWLMDSGIWSELSEAAKAVLPVLARHASPDGTSWPSHAVLQAQSGLARSPLYRALKELLDHPDRLLEKKGSGAWVVCPGRPFAGRGSPTRDGSSPQRDESPPTGTEQSPQRDTLFRQEQRSDRHTAPRQQRSSGASGTEFEVAVRLLMDPQGGGLRNDRRARELAGGYSLQEIKDAIANADVLAKRGKLETRPGYVTSFLTKGFELFEEVEQTRERSRRRALVERWKAVVMPRCAGKPDVIRLLRLAFESPEATVAKGIVTEADLNMEPDALFDLVVDRARRVVENGVSHGQ